MFMHTVRLVIGMSLVAGGAMLAQPFAMAVLQSRQQNGPPAGHVPSHPPLTDAMAMPPAPAAHGAATAWPSPVDPLMTAAGTDLAGFGIRGQGVDFRPDNPAAAAPSRLPPAPPGPLPPSAADMAPAPPSFTGAYRSTLDIPPPPLLDTQSPPPLSVGWSTHNVSRPAVAAADADGTPSTYIVRDGDDLTGIALRNYGTAGAASAIWAANRDRLQDPQLLPIGMPLRMPPSWTLPSAHAGAGGHAIEPSFGTASSAAASWRTARPASAESALAGTASWLQPGDGGGLRPSPASPPQSATVPPATVRVSPGDTLGSIANRYYGDETAAVRIWQANKDRLRSPDLLVVGMELLLP